MANEDLFIQAAEYVGANEGFATHAYWDVNAWRIGFGSDTRAKDQIRVKRGDVTTKEEALDNLRLRLPHFWSVVIAQAPEANALPTRAKVALLDMAYNYGSLPQNVVWAIRHGGGNLSVIASAIRRHDTDNRSVNAHRREKEIASVLGEDHPESVS